MQQTITTLLTISKHGNLVLVQLRQYLQSIYNKYPLKADVCSYSLGKLGPKAVTFAKNHVGDIASVVGLGLALKPAPKPKNQPQRRGLEFDEDLVVRDLDAEELFGREYDLLDERDITIDDLD